MTTYPNERLQGILHENFPVFIESWVSKYSTFDEAWNLCRSGSTMVGILLQYAPESTGLHWIGLRAATRALGILSLINQKLEFQRLLVTKDQWLSGSVSDSVLEHYRSSVTPLVASADESAKMTMGNDGTLSKICGLDMYIARSVLAAGSSKTSTASLATSPASSAFCITNKKMFNEELLRQANDIREFFPSSFFDPHIVRKSRYEREWVI